MTNKAALLNSVSEALTDGTISKNDLRALLKNQTEAGPAGNKQSTRLSAVDVMFYIAGIVLFAAIMALIAQSWESGAGIRIVLSVGIGIILWLGAYVLLESKQQSDIRRGLTGALLLTGSLCLIAGGFIITGEVTNYDNPSLYLVAGTLFALGMLHIGFAWRTRQSLILLIGILLGVMAFPAFAIALLQNSDVPQYVYNLIFAVSGWLLAYATRVITRLDTSRANLARSYDSLAAFTILMSLFAASFTDSTGLIWLLALIAGIVGLFYLSIVMQDKLLLGNGSFFLVLAVITTSFHYFSGYGVAVSLLISAAGLLATAALAAMINRRYIK